MLAMIFIVSILGDMILLLGLGLCMSVYLKTAVTSVVVTFCGYLGIRIVIGGFLNGFLAVGSHSGLFSEKIVWYATTIISVVVFGGLGMLLMRLAASGLRRNGI